jgi:hypothetical protein
VLAARRLLERGSNPLIRLGVDARELPNLDADMEIMSFAAYRDRLSPLSQSADGRSESRAADSESMCPHRGPAWDDTWRSLTVRRLQQAGSCRCRTGLRPQLPIIWSGYEPAVHGVISAAWVSEQVYSRVVVNGHGCGQSPLRRVTVDRDNRYRGVMGSWRPRCSSTG